MLLAFCLIVSAGVFLPETSHAKYAAIIVDADSGDILYSRNANTRNYPASLTKIMTLYLVFDALDRKKLSWNSRMKVSNYAQNAQPSRLGLRKGQSINVREATLALVTKSANDVARVVAEHLGGSEKNFAKIMTAKAKQLGMKSTVFKNASGLTSKGQLSTAHDMAKLGIAIMQNFPHYYHLFSTRSFKYQSRIYKNHNRLLGRYTGTDGIKTGYTSKSGFNLVASVERNGRRLIGVVFGGKTGKSRDRHMQALLNKSFKSINVQRVASVINNSKQIRAPRPDDLDFETAEVASSTEVAAVSETQPAVSENTQDTNQNSWYVQVGAFRKERDALRMGNHALDTLGNVGVGLAVVLAQRSTSRKKLYKVRLGRVTLYKAKKVCQFLQKKDIDCFPIIPNHKDGKEIAEESSIGSG